MLYSACTFLLFSGQFLLICLSRHLSSLRRSTEERSLSPDLQLYSRDNNSVFWSLFHTGKSDALPLRTKEKRRLTMSLLFIIVYYNMPPSAKCEGFLFGNTELFNKCICLFISNFYYTTVALFTFTHIEKFSAQLLKITRRQVLA